MKVCLSGIKQLNKDQIPAIADFIKFLQQEVPLRNNVHVYFLDERKVPMTTGVRYPHHKIVVLVKNRLLIDVLRTLSHEWIHEYQHQNMGVSDFSATQDIGGPEENMANALSGVFVKMFEKNFPNYTELLYGED